MGGHGRVLLPGVRALFLSAVPLLAGAEPPSAGTNDPFPAVRAAAAYLRPAHELLGDWARAIASYNHGTVGMRRAANQHSADFERIVREYRVHAGDTLGSIARRQGVSLAALRSLNGIKADSHHIRVGQRLKIPATLAEKRRAAAKSKATPGVQLVHEGENPFTIAHRYKISVSSLLAENGLVQHAIIHPGQRLQIPAKANP